MIHPAPAPVNMNYIQTEPFYQVNAFLPQPIQQNIQNPYLQWQYNAFEQYLWSMQQMQCKQNIPCNLQSLQLQSLQTSSLQSPQSPQSLQSAEQENQNKNKTKNDNKKRKKNNNKLVTKRMVIFDFDDTLFPTSAYNNKKLSFSKLNEYGKLLLKVIFKCIHTFGSKNIFIVTNGSNKWVYHSLQLLSEIINKKNEKLSQNKNCKNYFENIIKCFNDHKISITSARDLYSEQYPKKPEVWKTFAIKNLLIEHFKIKYKYNYKYIITSIGDSMDEFNATQNVLNILKHENEWIKTNDNFDLQRIKLNNAPSFDIFMDQLYTLFDSIDDYKKLKHSLDINFAITK